MSNFGAKLAELLERHNLRAAQLSQVTGISNALFSKWLNNQQSFVSSDDLSALTTAISSDAREQAELVRAHLLDECVGPGSELLDVRILNASGRAVREDANAYNVPLSPKLQRAFEVLMKESVSDADVRDIIISMANLLDRRPKPE